MAAAFQQEFGLESDFLPSSGGILEIILDEKDVVWTNRETRGVKPSNEEAITALRPYLT